MTASAPTLTRTATARPAVASQIVRLYLSEIRLFAREAQVMFFVFGFPVVTVLVLGGVFGTDTDDSGFEYVNPSHFYIAAYFGVMLAAIGLIMVPAHVATYRERGILRRFDAAGFPPWAFASVQFLAGITFAILGSLSLLATGALTNGIPPVDDVPRTVIGLIAGMLAFVSVGVALGTLLPNGRSAQGLGLTMFFPMFLLAGGGPPPEALSDTMQTISRWLPLTHVIRAAQEPWLGLGTGTDHLFIVIAILVVSTAVWLTRSGFVSGRA